ncbi:MAG: NUDIX domain-containing protein [Patescibacteria group bacterium]
MKSRLVVTAIIEKEGKVLLGKKKENTGPYPNTWHLSGGGVNLGEESVHDAVKREVTEETGLSVKKIERVAFDEDYEPDKHGELTHYVFLVFRIEPEGIDAVAADDLVSLQWIKLSELKSLALPRPSEKYFKERGLL